MKKILYLLATALFLSSCGVKYETIPYFTDMPVGNQAEDINNQTILKIQKNDILAITVSSLDEKSDAYSNLGNMGTVQPRVSGSNLPTPNGFIVDQQGNVQLPYLGSVKIEGLSTYDARKLIEKKLEEGKFLIKPVLNLRLVNFKISILGDVQRPGVYPVQSERITVIEALGMAGDLTITAKRNDVLLIRENLGKRQQVRLDLQSKDLFNSPYYYLENNDVIIVTPSSAKYASVDSSYRNVSLIISALSVIALLITRF
jgi:polysaccharide export outer membrane protein